MQQENKMKFVLKSGFIKILLKSKENGLFTRIIFVFFLIPSGFCLEGYFKEQNNILQISGGILKQNKKMQFAIQIHMTACEFKFQFCIISIIINLSINLVNCKFCNNLIRDFKWKNFLKFK